jgi:hypothetical protein
MSDETPSGEPPDRDLAGALAGYRAATLPYLLPSPGAQAVRATVRRRRQTRLTVSAVVAVVGMVVGTMLVLGAGGGARPGPFGPTMRAPTTAPLTTSEVKNATITVPDWGDSSCPTGTFRFTNGTYIYPPSPNLIHDFTMKGDLAFVDVDGDGNAEAIVLLTYNTPTVSAEQALALTRGADGTIRTLGQVTSASRSRQSTYITAVSAGDGGTVRVWWSDQQRTYGWSHGRFSQVAGPN